MCKELEEELEHSNQIMVDLVEHFIRMGNPANVTTPPIEGSDGFHYVVRVEVTREAP